MTKRITRSRQLWADRFAAPAAGDLLGALSPEAAPLARALRESLLASGEFCETVRWSGLPWRWALTYAAVQGEVVAYLVPNPDGPSAVFRLTHEQFTDLPTKKLSRYIRDGLAQSRLVAGVAWPEWPFQSQAQVKDLADLFAMLCESELTNA